MPLLINLVATRCVDGDHAMLFRWYNDHVHLLMGCEALREATLYRHKAAVAGTGPQYLCLYTFDSHADFMQFETSEARARAQAVVRSGWASTGIQILQRTQFQRLGRIAGPVASDDHCCTLLGLGPGPRDGVARWLNDRVHAAWCDAPGPWAWHRTWDAGDAGGEALVMGPGVDADAAGRAMGAWREGPADPAFGVAPATLDVRWQADYTRLRHWSR